MAAEIVELLRSFEAQSSVSVFESHGDSRVTLVFEIIFLSDSVPSGRSVSLNRSRGSDREKNGGKFLERRM